MREKPLPGPDLPDVQAAYRTHGRALWVRLYACCCDRELALEAVQEAFVRLLEQRRPAIDDVAAWLFTAGRNWLTDTARRRRPRQDIALEHVAGTTVGPVGVAQSAELHGQVREAVARLASRDREVLALKYTLDWSSRRIGAALGLTPEAVDMRMSRARRRIAALLSTAGVDHGIE